MQNPVGRPRHRRRATFLAAVIAVVAVAIVSTTYFLGLAPVAHWACVESGSPSTQVAWVPLSLANSPYGGTVFVNATVPSGPLGGSTPGLYVGGEESNGTVWGSFWQVIVTVSPVQNATSWGVGANVRCANGFSAAFLSASPQQVYTGAIFNWMGGPLFGPNSTTDRAEPTGYNLSSGANASSLNFSNGFLAANAPSVNTCGLGPQSIPVRSSSFTVWISHSSGDTRSGTPYTLPSSQAFHYIFPANFGAWQVDNLSAPGGPGGGWAFSYSPCP
jgi:hypothetical protein